MDYLSLINDFIDGEMEANSEDKLFYELASNRKLRTDLKQFIDFEKAVESEIDIFQASPEATRAIFGALNIDNINDTPDRPGKNNKTGAAAFLKRYSQGLTGALLSALITAIIFILCINPGTEIREIEKKIYISSPASSYTNHNITGGNDDKSTAAEIDNETPFARSKKSMNRHGNPLNTAAVGSNLRANSNLAKNEGIDNKSKQEANLKTEPDKLMKELDISPSNDNTLSHSSLLTRGGSVNLPIFDSYGDSPLFAKDNNETELIGIDVEIKGADYWNVDKATVSKSTEPAFENMSIAVLFELSNNLSIGANIRQEFFFQDYNGELGDDQYRFEQNTNYVSYGLIIRYEFLSLNNLNMISQFYAGANESGPIGRAMLGLTYDFADNLSFVLGAEASRLFYKQSGVDFKTDKLGLHYGVNVKF